MRDGRRVSFLICIMLWVFQGALEHSTVLVWRCGVGEEGEEGLFNAEIWFGHINGMVMRQGRCVALVVL